jgi:hypothetical protein
MNRRDFLLGTAALPLLEPDQTPLVDIVMQGTRARVVSRSGRVLFECELDQSVQKLIREAMNVR